MACRVLMGRGDEDDARKVFAINDCDAGVINWHAHDRCSDSMQCGESTPISGAFDPRGITRIDHHLGDQRDSGLCRRYDDDLVRHCLYPAMLGKVLQQCLLQCRVVVGAVWA